MTYRPIDPNLKKVSFFKELGNQFLIQQHQELNMSWYQGWQSESVIWNPESANFFYKNPNSQESEVHNFYLGFLIRIWYTQLEAKFKFNEHEVGIGNL